MGTTGCFSTVYNPGTCIPHVEGFEKFFSSRGLSWSRVYPFTRPFVGYALAFCF